MKVFRKVFAAAIALTAIAMASSAFAANAGTATYDASNATMKIADTEAFESNTQQITIAVVPTDLGNSEVSAEDIYYINQGTGADVATIAVNIGLKGALNVPADYEVRVGDGSDVLTYTVPAVQFNNDSKFIENPEVKGRIGVKASFTVNAATINKLTVNLAHGSKPGEYTWPTMQDIANISGGSTFTFGLEIVDTTGEVDDLSGISVTGVEVE